MSDADRELKRDMENDSLPDKPQCDGKFNGGYIKASKMAYDLLVVGRYKSTEIKYPTSCKYIEVKDNKLFYTDYIEALDNIEKQFYINNGALSWDEPTTCTEELYEEALKRGETYDDFSDELKVYHDHCNLTSANNKQVEPTISKTEEDELTYEEAKKPLHGITDEEKEFMIQAISYSDLFSTVENVREEVKRFTKELEVADEKLNNAIENLNMLLKRESMIATLKEKLHYQGKE